MHPLLLIGLIAAAVIALIIRRLRGEPLTARELFGAPLILIAIGGYSVVKLPVFTPTDGVWLGAGAVAGLGFGALRGLTIRLFTREGVLWQRYTGWTFGVWVLSFAGNFGLGHLAVACGMHADARPMPLSIGVSLLGEALVIGKRALDSGVPFAPSERISYGARRS
ncbi:DUF1453 domain-containing protein [Amycolatopsis anabasis]|uniref:DUF1453 domain-containing protein n=1 Tax=Amycolatopsis anabasis TaxID=1840409 RepID=UPI00131D87E0|nr:DUF1453 domain-containing protein [Amycolatopsis anabasis]